MNAGADRERGAGFQEVIATAMPMFWKWSIWQLQRITIGKMDRGKTYNKSATSRLRHFLADYQRDWDIYVQRLTYSYSSQLLQSTTLTFFSLVLITTPPWSDDIWRPDATSEWWNSEKIPACTTRTTATPPSNIWTGHWIADENGTKD